MKILLNQVLDNRGISQNQLAKDTGISTATLRNLNHNRTTRISFVTVVLRIFFILKNKDCPIYLDMIKYF